MGEEQKKPKATERLAALEKTILGMSNTLGATARRVGEMELIMFNLSRENEILKEALSLLNEKQLAIVALSSSGQKLSNENINEQVVSMKEAAMGDKIKELESNGEIVAIDVVEENSLIISRELNDKGEVENPRLQFLVGKLVDELKAKFVGKKAGDLIKGEEGKLDIEIMGIYNFVEKELDPELPPENIDKGPGADGVSSGESEEKAETKE
jgi:hypothetical protein